MSDLDALDAYFAAMQSGGARVLSNATQARRVLDRMRETPTPDPEPTPEPIPDPEPTPVPVPGVRGVGKVDVTRDGQLLERVAAEHIGFVTSAGGTLRDFTARSVAVASATGVTIEDGTITGRPGSDGVHITSDRGSLCRDVTIRRVEIPEPTGMTAAQHYDGIQARGVDGLLVEDVNINLGPHDPQDNAALFLQDAQGGCRNVVVRRSVLKGGGYALYLFAHELLLEDVIVGGGRWGLLYPNSWISGVTLRNVRDDQGRLLKLTGTDGACALVPA